jgi:hypothetical protein
MCHHRFKLQATKCAKWYRVVQPGTASQAGTRATEVQPRATPVTSSRGACVLRTACCRDGDVVFVVVVVLPTVPTTEPTHTVPKNVANYRLHHLNRQESRMTTPVDHIQTHRENI